MSPQLPSLTRRTLLTSAATGALLAGASSTTAQASRLPATIALPNGIRPEGITSGPGATFYVGSLSDGRIVTGSLRTGSVRTLLPGATGRSIRGLFHDPRTGLVWAVGNLGTVGHVWAVDDRTGTVVSDTVIPGAVFLNDLVVTRRAVYVTDSQVDRLTVVPLGRGGRPLGAAATFVPLGGAWPAGDGVNINANGIRDLPGGSLVLNNSRVGGLWDVDPTTGVARRIPVSGGPGIVSGDGLERRGATLWNVRGSGPNQVAVVRLACGADGWRATWVSAVTAPTLDVPSTATYAVGSLWAVNARFGVPSPDTATYSIARLPTR
ncbi:hypothetical protein PZ938_06905 [Luteipulveratus sp. YIM 133132]|uniref:hypothetical protein n=1 Tax=Luteipulveratus flavus TaxID=3031728 RepID=UPI0023AF63AF|nr:hypothetical protein [Luteipulveratus sp. YIM 133132]MDE9365332.1 hypothetical protein [Luteipulveratus sp. YIM 133132]